MEKKRKCHNYYVYLLTNKLKTVLYVGVTNNLKRRLGEHAASEKGTKSFTHRCNCSYLFYFEHFTYIISAIKREKQIKRWSRSKKEALIKTLNPDWNFLNETV